MTEGYWTAYSEEADITFIMKDEYIEDRHIGSSVTGYYWGKPDPEKTEYYKDKPNATL